MKLRDPKLLHGYIHRLEHRLDRIHLPPNRDLFRKAELQRFRECQVLLECSVRGRIGARSVPLWYLLRRLTPEWGEGVHIPYLQTLDGPFSAV